MTQLKKKLNPHLSNDGTDVSQQSDSRSHIIPHFLWTEVNLHFDNSATVVIAVI